jgi:hypothetical protein
MSFCRTTNMNEIINVLTRNSKGLEGAKKGKAVKNDSLSVYVPRAGIEPALPKEQDFESSASTSSATEAFKMLSAVKQVQK